MRLEPGSVHSARLPACCCVGLSPHEVLEASYGMLWDMFSGYVSTWLLAARYWCGHGFMQQTNCSQVPLTASNMQPHNYPASHTWAVEVAVAWALPPLAVTAACALAAAEAKLCCTAWVLACSGQAGPGRPQGRARLRHRHRRWLWQSQQPANWPSQMQSPGSPLQQQAELLPVCMLSRLGGQPSVAPSASAAEPEGTAVLRTAEAWHGTWL